VRAKRKGRITITVRKRGYRAGKATVQVG